MNEYNHYRIIERVALDRGLDASIKKIFIEASDFTDFFWSPTISAKNKYYFYLYYYDITIKGTNAIKLNRITKNDYDLGIRKLKRNNSILCMEKSGEKLLDGSYSLEGWDPSHDEKEFFSSVNNRKRSPKEALVEIIGDTANQSDNVAFLHAMGAMDENKDDSRDEFVRHLKKCFSEYLFLEKEKDALFMLGIAFHGIMDSFTPSHMDFQKYSAQDMGLHAQGDVIPIMGKFDKDGKLIEGNFSEQEEVIFDPGQFTKEILPLQLLYPFIKHFDDNDFVNPVEYKMLRVFFHISDIGVGYGKDWASVGDIDKFWKTFKGCTLKQIKEILRHGKYRYGPKSYAYSEAAIRVISDIYKYLSKKREECKNYSEYKNNKQEIVNDALDIWKKVYDKEDRMDKDGNIIDEDGNIVFLFDNQKKSYAMKTLREEHLSSLEKETPGSLYFEDDDIRRFKEGKDYQDWLKQQEINQRDIDRLNRLKG